MPNIANNTKQSVLLFSDAATSPQTAIAVGAFLYLPENELQLYDNCNFENLFFELTKKVNYLELASKKSTWSEIKTILSAINIIHMNYGINCPITVYTDCQSLCDLVIRRKFKLQKNNFITRAGKTLAHAELYKELFSLVEKSFIQFIKVKGHNKRDQQLTLPEKIFILLDQLSRKKLRSL
jgi:ribonuclease HI